MTHSTVDNGSHILGWSVAALIGASLGLLFLTDKGKEVREETTEKAKDLAKKFNKTRKDVQSYVGHIFGQVSEELEKNYLEIKGYIIANIEEQKNNFNEKKYDHLVDETVKKFSKGREWSKDTLNKLSNHLKEDWKEIKEDFKTT